MDEHHGKCLDCGDDWIEDEVPTICPECHSVNVIEETTT